MTEIKKESAVAQCHVDKLEITILRGKSSDLLLNFLPVYNRGIKFRGRLWKKSSRISIPSARTQKLIRGIWLCQTSAAAL